MGCETVWCLTITCGISYLSQSENGFNAHIFFLVKEKFHFEGASNNEKNNQRKAILLQDVSLHIEFIFLNIRKKYFINIMTQIV